MDCKDLYKDAFVDTQRFRDAVRDYEKSALVRGSRHNANFDWDHSHTWEEVLDAVDEAARANMDTSTIWGKVRQAFRSMGDHHDVLGAWTNVLPTQSPYASVVFGGLKLIIGAASRLKSLREEVCTALSQIPASLFMTRVTLDTFNASIELRKCSAALYVAILAALDHILIYFKGNSASRMMKATFKQSGYGTKLSDKIQNMKDCAEMFNRLAVECSYQTQKSTLGSVKALEFDENARHQDIMRNIEVSRSETRLQHSDMGKNLNSVKTEIKKVFEELSRRRVSFDGYNCNVRYFLYPESDSATTSSTSARGNALSKQSSYMRKKPGLHILESGDKLVGLECQIHFLTRDIEANLRHVWTMSRPAQDRAVALMESHQLHAWLSSRNSLVLFVNGNHEASARLSPFTYVCTRLMNHVCPSTAGTGPGHPFILAAVFFCGQQLDTDEPVAGPIGMMRSLVSQLIIGYKVSGLPIARRLLNIGSFDNRELCKTFTYLIKQLPAQYAVLCIIDGITFYEDSPTHCGAAQEAVLTMLEVVDDCNTRGSIFKLLITNPGASRMLYQEFEADEIIWLPRKVSSRGGLTSAKWEASVGPYVTEWMEGCMVE